MRSKNLTFPTNCDIIKPWGENHKTEDRGALPQLKHAKKQIAIKLPT